MVGIGGKRALIWILHNFRRQASTAIPKSSETFIYHLGGDCYHSSMKKIEGSALLILKQFNTVLLIILVFCMPVRFHTYCCQIHSQTSAFLDMLHKRGLSILVSRPLYDTSLIESDFGIHDQFSHYLPAFTMSASTIQSFIGYNAICDEPACYTVVCVTSAKSTNCCVYIILGILCFVISR